MVVVSWQICDTSETEVSVMKFKIHENFLIDCFKDIVSVPNPVGYYVKLNPVLETYAAKFGKP